MRKPFRRHAACLWLSSFLLLYAEARPAEGPWQSWRHALGREHPLAGRVWDVEHAAWVEPHDLGRRLGPVRYVLLGEKHDNADHHRLQAWVIGPLVSSGRRPAVAFEMLEIDEQSTIDRQLETAPADLAGFRTAVGWDDRGWPAWELYEPVFAAALNSRLPISAANLSRASTRELASAGASVLDPELASDFGLDQPLAPETQQRLAHEFESSHCGHGSAGAAAKMILVQRARDAMMARRLTRLLSEGGAVLIAGAFHVRNDDGVPSYLAKVGAQGEVASLAFMEVRDDATEPAAYAAAFARDSLPFDYVWFTTRVDDDDPCEKFAEQLKQMRKP